MRVNLSTSPIGQDEIASAAGVLDRGELGQGIEVESFELAFARYLGAANAVAVNSGSTALSLALRALGVHEGDEVVVPALGSFATIEAVAAVGAVPVFADIDPATHTMSPHDLGMRITAKTRAVISVHTYGGAADLVGINVTLAEHRTLQGRELPFVVEDCAQALGTKVGGDLVGAGHYSSAACFSFGPTKHITTIEGGMVTCESGQIADELRLARNHGAQSAHHHVTLGGNYRLNDVGAAIGREQLNRFPESLAARRTTAFAIATALDELEWLTPAFDLEAASGHSWYRLAYSVNEGVIGRNVAEVVTTLEKAGVESWYRYLAPLYKQPALRGLVPDNYRLKAAEELAGRIIGLPCRPGMTQAEIDHVIGVVHSVKKPRSILPGRLLGRGK